MNYCIEFLINLMYFLCFLFIGNMFFRFKRRNNKNVTGAQLAKEIYGHAMVYYRWAVLGDIPLINNLVYSHVADGVDLDNKVDKYQNVWEFLWNF